VLWLRRHQAEASPDLVTRSYDRLAPGYDAAWTHHMRDLSLALLDRLGPVTGAEAADLMCGTGFVTAELARRTGRAVVGVDRSDGMLAVGRAGRLPPCRFEQADVLDWLRARPAASLDLVTSAWGLGYSRPRSVLAEVRRVLRPGGRFAIVDNTLGSLREVVWASVLTFAEQPEALTHALRVGFVSSRLGLALLLRRVGLRPRETFAGARSWTAASGEAALARLRATGAAAGFELACGPADAPAIFRRFTEIIEARARPGPIAVTHRYAGAIGVRP
jgi:ubiquinone/menaquinone biosynthesis C-methylase UbiE